MKVAVLDPIHAEPLSELEAAVDVIRWDNPAVFDLSDVDGLIVRTAKVTASQIASAPKLHVIGVIGMNATGVNTIDVAAARKAGVSVVYTPTANVNSVAELVIMLMLAVSRKLRGNMTHLRHGASRISPPELTGLELSGKTLGLVGFGRIARRVGEIARMGFSMNIVAYDPFCSEEMIRAEQAVQAKDLKDLLAQTDFISVSVPHCKETHNLIGTRELDMVKPNAILVNTAQGGVVNEAALAEALKHHKLAGAACDVFEQEPPSWDGTSLFHQQNFLGTLHVGANTEETLWRAEHTVVEDVLAVLNGKTPQFLYTGD